VLRATLGHGWPLGGCCVEGELLLTSCCSTARKGRGHQQQLELLHLLAGAAAHPVKGMSRKHSAYKTTLL